MRQRVREKTSRGCREFLRAHALNRGRLRCGHLPAGSLAVVDCHLARAGPAARPEMPKGPRRNTLESPMIDLSPVIRVSNADQAKANKIPAPGRRRREAETLYARRP